MEIRPGRMVHLGHGRYWRSDQIVGVTPIEEERGPGRRTRVYVADRQSSLIASRSERAILREMVRSGAEHFRAEKARELFMDLLDDMEEITPALRRLLRTESRVDVDGWERRIQSLLETDHHDDGAQADLFSAPD